MWGTTTRAFSQSHVVNPSHMVQIPRTLYPMCPAAYLPDLPGSTIVLFLNLRDGGGVWELGNWYLASVATFETPSRTKTLQRDKVPRHIANYTQATERSSDATAAVLFSPNLDQSCYSMGPTVKHLFLSLPQRQTWTLMGRKLPPPTRLLSPFISSALTEF